MRPALLLLLVAVVTLPAIGADKAKALYAKGQDAEARQQYETAYNFFKQAYDLKPKELAYRSAFERLRFQAAASIVHHGQQLRDDGKFIIHRQAGTEPYGEDDQRPAESPAAGRGPARRPGAQDPRSSRTRGTRSHLEYSDHS
jgi:hypothetical protein